MVSSKLAFATLCVEKPVLRRFESFVTIPRQDSQVLNVIVPSTLKPSIQNAQ